MACSVSAAAAAVFGGFAYQRGRKVVVYLSILYYTDTTNIEEFLSAKNFSLLLSLSLSSRKKSKLNTYPKREYRSTFSSLTTSKCRNYSFFFRPRDKKKKGVAVESVIVANEIKT
jgi:hypothetical protein